MATWPAGPGDPEGGLLGRLWRWLRADRFRRRLAGGALALLLLAAALWGIPTPYFITAPGTAVAAERLVTVPGAVQGSHRSRYLILTVSSQPANLFWYLYSQVDRRRTVLETRENYLGFYPNYEEYQQDTARMMEDSRRFAAAAALRALGYHVQVVPEGVYVSAVLATSPGRGLIRAGDVIRGMGGQPIATEAELRAALAATAPGQPVQLLVRRQGQDLEVAVPTAPHPDRPGAALGIIPVGRYRVDLPVDVVIQPGAITGPSAGLVFSLEILDRLSRDDLAGGWTVAGTGSVDPSGAVGEVGGVRQKVFTAEAARADVLFVPAGNYQDAAAVATRIRVVPVQTVDDAVAWLRQHRPAPGGAPPG